MLLVAGAAMWTVRTRLDKAHVALGFLLGAVVGSGLIAFKLRTRKDPVPFGPFMAAGAMVAVFAGTQLLDLYRGT